MLTAFLLPLLFQIRVDENQTRIAGRHTIRLAIPADPEVRELGGSGGPIQEIHVTDRETGKRIIFTEQAIWVDAVPMKWGYPVLYVWTKSSIDAFSRCRMEPRRKTYEMTTCEDYERDLEGKLVRTKAPPRLSPWSNQKTR